MEIKSGRLEEIFSCSFPRPLKIILIYFYSKITPKNDQGDFLTRIEKKNRNQKILNFN